MDVTFYGAVREVTGSMHLISTDNDRILLDCGMFQGRRKETAEKNTVMPVDPGAAIRTAVLSSKLGLSDPIHGARMLGILLQQTSGSYLGFDNQGGSGQQDIKNAVSVTIESNITPIRLIPMTKQRWILARASRDDMVKIEFTAANPIGKWWKN